MSASARGAMRACVLAMLTGVAAFHAAPRAQTAVTLQPPNLSGAVSGTLVGQAGVGSSGAASYSVPIKIPPGTAGVVPSVSLNYQSQGGEGITGFGWTIGGLSEITRCPASIAIDGFPGSVGLDANDRYCLDGQRLVIEPGSGTYGASATYRTEVDGISRITSYGSDPAVGPTYWKVETKAGLIKYYGSTSDSSVDAQGTSKPLKWALAKVEDRRGNYYTIFYGENPPTGEHYPVQIRYTGNANGGLAPYAAVRFEYDSTPLAEKIVRYVADSRILIAGRISKISTWVNTNPADGSGGTLVNELRIGYVQSATTGRSLVDTLRWCDGAGACLPATQFAWQQIAASERNHTAPGSGNWGGPSFPANELPNVVRSEVISGDFDGDGRMDLAKSMENGFWKICLSTGSAFNCQDWAGPGRKVSWIITGDFNGDGRTDLLDPNQTNWGVCLSTGSSFDCQVWPAMTGNTIAQIGALGPSFTYLSVDLTGDGRDDVLVRTSTYGATYLCVSSGTGVSCAPYAGSGFFDPRMIDYLSDVDRCFVQTTRWRPLLGDFNGDKRVDVVPVDYQETRCPQLWPTPPNNSYAQCNAGATGTTCRATVTGLGPNLGFIPRVGTTVGDLNGDGLPDLVLHSLVEGTTNSIKVCLSTGGTGQVVSCANQTFATANEAFAFNVSDVDGDGRADVYGGSGLCRHSNGVLLCQPWGGTLSQSGDMLMFYGDFNGDGKMDVAAYSLPGSYWRISLAGGPIPDLLSSVTDGYGQVTQFDYSPIAKYGSYVAGSSTEYPKRNSNTGTTVVSQMRIGNGLGGWLVTDYQYEGNRSDLERRGSLGFEKTRVIDRIKNVTAQTTVSQSFPYTGMPVEVRSTQANGTVLSLRTNTLASFATVGSARFPYIANSTVTLRDLNGAALSTETTSIAPTDIDIYGNVRKTVGLLQGGGDTFASTVDNEFDVRPATWLVGLMSKNTVTKASTLSPPPVVGIPSVAVTPTTLAFGTVAKMRFSASQTVTVSNSGNAPTTLNFSIVHTGGAVSIGNYQLTGGTCTQGGTLPAAGSSCTISVRYAADCANGGRTANLNIQPANVPPFAIHMGAATGGGTCN